MLPGAVLSFLTLGVVPLVAAQNPYPITGVSVDPRAGSIPLRKNINDFEAEGGPQWDLYIRALRAMFDADSSNMLSYFQISGIHGKPFVEWNRGGPRRTNGWLGYCPHGEELFLPWHRAYTLLFEQVLVDNARRIARDYRGRSQGDYAQAAERLRAPFWDWASDPEVPPVTAQPRIRVNVPNGDRLRQIEIDNPLYTFRFPSAALNGEYGDFDSRRRERTFRCQGRSYPESANENMYNRPYKEWTYDALTRSQTFANFSSTNQGGVSLEQIHNGVHWDAGCGGQFLNSEFSAFDPIFMLHHCNVDRLWAYWQAMRPENAIFTRTYAGGSRFSTPPGTRISPQSPLNPFFRNGRDLHTSESVASIRGFGYSYQGLEYWSKSPEQLRRDARTIVNQLYSDDDSSFRLMRRDEETTRYFVNVQLDVTQVERPCSVDIYVDDEHAGSLVIMVQPSSGTSHGSFAIDKAVKKKGLNYLSTDEAVKKIESTLKVKITKGIDGEEIPTSSVPSLLVELEDVSVTLPSRQDELPKFGDSRRRPAFGRGKRQHKDNIRHLPHQE